MARDCGPVNAWRLMKMDSDFCPPSKPVDSSRLKIAIVYEDFASGTRAKHFADRLAERLDSTCDVSGSLWRSELLACPAIAAEASLDAADSDFLIVSLRGDHVPTCSTRQWIKAQLATAARRGAALIFLADGIRGGRRVAEATRKYFRKTCAGSDVPFFSLVANPEPIAVS